MPTGNDILNIAIKLLNYDNEQNSPLLRNSLTYINSICTELSRLESKSFTPLSNMSDTVNLSTVSIYEIAPYGVAMWLANSNSDNDNQAYFSSLYTQKRSLVQRTRKTIRLAYPAKDYGSDTD